MLSCFLNTTIKINSLDMFSFSFSGRCSTQLHSEDTRTTTLQAAPKVTNFLFLSAFIHIVLPYSGFINAQNIKL